MSQTTALNPMLYRRLAQRFGEVEVRDQGQARVVRRAAGLDDTTQQRIVQYGEGYHVDCPVCRGPKQLSISHMYAQPDDSGRPMLHLAHCFRRDCLKNPSKRRELAELLNAGDGMLSEARIRPGKVLTDEERIPQLPTHQVAVGELPEDHRARRWLERQGFDPVKVGGYYGLCACPGSDDPLLDGRIVIPVEMRGKYQGWQSLATGPVSRGREYLSAPGMRTADLIYNLDRALEYESPVVVQTPADVWAFGPMAVCALGGSLSDTQARVLRAVLRKRSAVLLLRREARPSGGAGRLRRGLEDSLGRGLLVVEYGEDVPPGRAGRKALRDLVKREAQERGVEVALSRRE